MILATEIGEQFFAQPPGNSGAFAARNRDPLLRDDAALVEHQHPVGQRDRLLHIMGHDQHGGPVRAPERQDEVVHAITGQRVEGGEGLVEQQQLGFAHQSAGERDALRLPAGERQRPGVEPMTKADLLERGFAAVAHPVALRPRATFFHTGFQGSSRASWNTTARESGTSTS